METNADSRKPMIAYPLLLAVGIIAICGIIYELIIGAISSYLLGNSVKQYSITIGLFMSAMGIGSYVTKYIKSNLFDTFILIELVIGLLGGLSAVSLFIAYAYTDVYHLIMYLSIILIGILVGLEIPLLTRIIESNAHNLRVTIANVLSFDYIGALFGSLAFPLVLLPHLGEIRTSFLVGLLNISVAVMMIFYYRDFVKRFNMFKFIAFVMIMISLFGLFYGEQIGKSIEDKLYRDKIIYSHQSKYQKIVVTRHKDDIRMFLDGNIQFSSLDEYRYHEALVHPAMSLSNKRKEILILGGGDGMAVREILKYDDVENITMVDLDPDVVSFCRSNPLISKINGGALNNEKLTIINQDAYQFLEENDSKFDVIFIDLPDPNNESLNKLYTNIFYRLVYSHLNKGGMVAIQSTSPYYAGQAYWCIRETVASEGFFTSGYHVNVPSFGDWGFTLASNQEYSKDDIKIQVPMQYLNEETISAMFSFSQDELKYQGTVEINSLTNAVLIRYYQDAWRNM